MTGRELIVYILENHLEDEPVIKDGTVIGFASIPQAAALKDVGTATIKASIIMGKIPFDTVKHSVQIPLNSIERSK